MQYTIKMAEMSLPKIIQGSKLKKFLSRLLATIKEIKVAKCKNLVAR